MCLRIKRKFKSQVDLFFKRISIDTIIQKAKLSTILNNSMNK